MKHTLIPILLSKKKWHLWLISVILAIALTLPTVATMQFLLEGKITTNYLITGFVSAVLAASIVSGLLIYLLKTLHQLHQHNEHLNAIIDVCPVPIVVFKDTGQLIRLNPQFTKSFGYTHEDITTISDWWLKAYPEEHYRASAIESWNSHLNDCAINQSSFVPLDLKIHCKNQAVKSIIATTTPLDKGVSGAQLLVLFDVSEKANLFDALIESRNILQSIIETIPMRIFWKDKNSRYIGCNSNFARDAGFNNVNEIIGKYDDDLAWQARADYYRAIDLEVMQRAVPKASYEELEKTADGHEMILKSSKIPLRQDSGEVIGVLGIYEDITQIKKSEAEQIINRERLNFALKGANDGLWDWNLDTNEVYYSPRWKSMLGYRDDELGNTLDTWSSLVDPKDSAATLAHAQSYINGDRASFETEFRMKHKDGHWVDILSRAKLALDVNGVVLKPQRLIGTHVDISHLKSVESELRKKEGYQRALLDNFPFMVWLKDLESRFLSVNKVHANNFGENNPESLVGKTDFDYSPIEIAENYRKDDLSVLQTRQPKSVEETYVDTKGNQHWIETFKAPVTDQDGNLLGTVGFARDISDRKKIETELQIAATAFESQEGMIVTDAYSNILKINHSFTRITGFTADEAVGKKMNLLRSGVHDAAFYKDMWDSIQSQGSWQGEIWNKRKCGEIYPEWLTITAVKNRDNIVTHYVGTMIDITARKSIEERVHHLAHYDPLTDLPNRTLLTDRLHQALAQVRREKTKLALMFLDLDKFKPVNDLLGHDIGDLLLKAVAERLTTRIKRQTDTVARIGGDEFVIVLSQIESNQDAAMVANEVVSALTQPFLIEQHTIHISCSIGIGIYPLHGSDVVSLMRVADQAMYEAKRAGRGCFRFYTEETTNQSSLDSPTQSP